MNITPEDLTLCCELVEDRIRHLQHKVDAHERKERLAPAHSRAHQLKLLYRRLERLEDALDRLESPAPTPAFTTRTIGGGA